MQSQKLVNDKPAHLLNRSFACKDTLRMLSIPEHLESRKRALLVSEVAGLLNVSGRQIYKLAKEKRIPSIRIAGCVRFDPIVLAAWIRRNATGTSHGAVLEPGVPPVQRDQKSFFSKGGH